MRPEKHSLTLLFPPPDSQAVSQFKILDLIRIPHLLRSSTAALVGVSLLGCGAVYAVARHGVLAAKNGLLQMENRKLREENDEVKVNWDRLQARLALLETTSRQLAEASGLARPAAPAAELGSGGPAGGAEAAEATATLERALNRMKEIFDARLIKLASTPSSWPVRGSVTDRYGWRSNPFGGGSERHSGLDIAAPFGTGVEATADGIVIFAGAQAGYGNVVVIDHGYGLTTRYGHLSRIHARVGERARRGAQVGAVGSTGRSTGPHCHYEVRLYDQPVNPINYIPVGGS